MQHEGRENPRHRSLGGERPGLDSERGVAILDEELEVILKR